MWLCTVFDNWTDNIVFDILVFNAIKLPIGAHLLHFCEDVTLIFQNAQADQYYVCQ